MSAIQSSYQPIVNPIQNVAAISCNVAYYYVAGITCFIFGELQFEASANGFGVVVNHFDIDLPPNMGIDYANGDSLPINGQIMYVDGSTVPATKLIGAVAAPVGLGTAVRFFCECNTNNPIICKFGIMVRVRSLIIQQDI